MTTANPLLLSGTIKGCEKMVSRDMNAADYQTGIIAVDDNFSIGLDVKDDRTATLTIEMTSPMATGAGDDPQSGFGSVSYTCVCQVDVRGERPVITDAKLG